MKVVTISCIDNGWLVSGIDETAPYVPRTQKAILNKKEFPMTQADQDAALKQLVMAVLAELGERLPVETNEPPKESRVERAGEETTKQTE